MNELKFLKGTKESYDNLENKNANSIYFAKRNNGETEFYLGESAWSSDGIIYDKISTVSGDIISIIEDDEKITASALNDLNNKINSNKLLDKQYTDDDLTLITESGEYLYKNVFDRVEQLLVLDYPGYYVIQYKFTNNNIVRRYGVYTDGILAPADEWTGWVSIGNSNYNPSSDLLVTARAISKGIKDSNRNGLTFGNVLNNRYFAVSNYDAACMYVQSFETRKNNTSLFLKQYDLVSSDIFTKQSWRYPSDTYRKTTEDNVLEFALYNNGGTATANGTGIQPNNEENYIDLRYLLNLPSEGANIKSTKIIVTVVPYNNENRTIDFYCNTNNGDMMQFGPTFNNKTDIINNRSHIQIHTNKETTVVLDVNIHYSDGSFDNQQFIKFKADGYCYIKSVSVLNNNSNIDINLTQTSIDTINVSNGDGVSLYNVFKYLMCDNIKINIGEGYYFLGEVAPDPFDNYSVIVTIKNSNIQINGDGKDKTIISGIYINSFGMRHAILQNEGANNTFKNFTIISEYVLSQDGQAPAVAEWGNNTIWENCGIHGMQDTLYLYPPTNNEVQYFFNCDISGTVDFIFGGGNLSWFNNCNLICNGRPVKDVICAPLNNMHRGIVFNNCTINGTDDYVNSMNNNYALARPWGNNGKVYYMGTHFNITPSIVPYEEMAGNVLDSYSGDINGTAMNWKDKLEYRPNFTKDYITNQLTNEEIDIIQAHGVL